MPKAKKSFCFTFKFGLTQIVPITKAVQEVVHESGEKLIGGINTKVIIPNGIDLTRFIPKDSLAKDTILIGNTVRLSEEKQVDILIHAAKILKDKGYDFKVKVAGTGPQKDDLNKLIRDFGLTEKVSLIGHIENVPEFLNELDIFAFTSKYEGASRSIIEAMATGLPVVAFDISSMGELLASGQGLAPLVRPFDIEEFAGKIEDLIKDSDLRQSFGASGVQVAAKRYNKENNLGQWLNILS